MPTPQYKRACLSWRSHLAPSTAIAQRRADPSPWQGSKFKLTLLSGMQMSQHWGWENRRAYNNLPIWPHPSLCSYPERGPCIFSGQDSEVNPVVWRVGEPHLKGLKARELAILLIASCFEWAGWGSIEGGEDKKAGRMISPATTQAQEQGYELA